MLDWKKQILKKRRITVQQIIEKTDDNEIIEHINEMYNHFWKLLSCLLKLKNSQNYDEEDINITITEKPAISFIQNIQEKLQHRYILFFYRKIRIILNSFQEQIDLQEFDSTLRNIFHTENITLSFFFEKSCWTVIKYIRQTIKEKKRSQILSAIQQQQKVEEKSKISYKEYSLILCQGIYSILDLQKVEACFYLIQEADVVDNVNLLLDRQMGRNKQIRKKIKKFKHLYQSFLNNQHQEHENINANINSQQNENEKKPEKRMLKSISLPLKTADNKILIRTRILTSFKKKRNSNENLRHKIQNEAQNQNENIKSFPTFRKEKVKLRTNPKNKHKLRLIR